MRRTLIHAALIALVALGATFYRPDVDAQITPYGYWVPPSNCITTVSAGSTGTNGLTTAGTSFMPVVQAQTDNAGVIHTHTYVCNLAPPSYLTTTGSRIQIQDAVFFYGTQTTALGTQVATLSSGTMNSSTVFRYVNYPSPGASETPSTVAPVRADSGTLVITPIVASFNTSTTTAGSFYSVKFQPASVISWNTDLKQLLLTVTLVNVTTSATVTNSPGVLVHVRSQ